MKRYLFGLSLLCVTSSAFAQSPDSLAAPDSVVITTPPIPPPPPVTEPASDIRTTQTYAKDNKPPRWYYGVTLGFNFWGDVRRFSIQPMLGFKLTPRLSIGGEVGYEYLKDTSGSVDRDYNNYGASVFSRFRLTPRLYAHGEYTLISYDFAGGREVVPFLLVGGGIVQSAGRKVSLYAEVLVDLLQDENSPYNDWEPQVSVGAAVGF